VIDHLKALGHEVLDCGSYDPAAVDYPDVAEAVCRAIQEGQVNRGILICGTGIGMCMAANRHAGIRAATCTTPEMVRLSRTHNDANILCLGRRILSLEDCIELIDLWLDTDFSGADRHIRRVGKLH
jgi:ribose 5-phosphate isomerase B